MHFIVTFYFCFFNVVFLYLFLFFFFNDTATTEIYTLSLHDALPISRHRQRRRRQPRVRIGDLRSVRTRQLQRHQVLRDRKSTRLNSSHPSISYAVFCLKKKKKNNNKPCKTNQTSNYLFILYYIILHL